MRGTMSSCAARVPTAAIASSTPSQRLAARSRSPSPASSQGPSKTCTMPSSAMTSIAATIGAAGARTGGLLAPTACWCQRCREMANAVPSAATESRCSGANGEHQPARSADAIAEPAEKRCCHKEGEGTCGQDGGQRLEAYAATRRSTGSSTTTTLCPSPTCRASSRRHGCGSPRCQSDTDSRRLE